MGQIMVAAKDLQVSQTFCWCQQMTFVGKLWIYFSRVNFGPTTPIFKLDLQLCTKSLCSKFHVSTMSGT